ncbi:ATP synthase subunit I [Clostridium sp. D2Q-11]|uniref:ATP synthase subunit I n=1 Tax=Anaeromonas frigoriresistens TaxID=2683708 RepID=A0A942Z8T4_9FIRM|nr:ATP synthase subunit I [Anaeromonas frigoriresistens]MBS4538329.1 ATP synthase subunit I [Anaeromonas frigoriresistens]
MILIGSDELSLVQNTGYKIMKRVAILTAIISVIILIVVPDPKPYVLGLIFGAIINLLNFRLMSITLNKSVNMSQGKIMPYIVANYVARYLIYGVVLTVAAFANYLNFLTVILGIFMVKLTIISDAFYESIKKGKNKEVSKKN